MAVGKQVYACAIWCFLLSTLAFAANIPLIHRVSIADRDTGTRGIFEDGATLVRSHRYMVHLGINALTQSVSFQLDGSLVEVENSAPFPHILKQLPGGSHVIVVTPYPLVDAGGIAGAPLTINFTVQRSPSPTPTPTPPTINHVFRVMLENHSYEEVVGTNAMPYLQSLIDAGGLATDFYAVTHPSIGNYFDGTTGEIVTNSDQFSKTVSIDNMARQLIAAGKTWHEYSENLPAIGYTGDDKNGYSRHHNPFSFFSDVRGNPAQASNLVPFTQLSDDIANNTLPNYGFIVPSNAHNAHKGSLKAADDWLQSNIGPLVNSAAFGDDSVLIVQFDESEGNDQTNGGGHIEWMAYGTPIKKGFTSSTFYQHPSALHFECDMLGIATPSAAAGEASMNEFLVIATANAETD